MADPKKGLENAKKSYEKKRAEDSLKAKTWKREMDKKKKGECK